MRLRHPSIKKIKLNRKIEITSSSHARHVFLLTWTEGNPPYKFENFKKLDTWRFRSHKQAKLGDEIYLLKQGKNNAGIFGFEIKGVSIAFLSEEYLADRPRFLVENESK
jgi:hypothetical protein